jgi:tRNA(fMet)-specific endonuclease VapC
MKICLDTNAYTEWVRDGVWASETAKADQIVIPSIVLGELREGFLGGNRPDANEALLSDVLGCADVSVILVGEETSRIYAELKHFLRKQGSPLPLNDIWIAACTMEHGAILLTRDRHFQNLPQVRVMWPEG